MKTIHWAILGLMLLFVVSLLVAGALYIQYTIMEPKTHPLPAIHDVEIKAVIVTVPVEVVRTVEVVITATPLPPTVEPAVLPLPVIQPTLVPTPILPTPKTCADIALLDSQTRDFVQGDAKKIGTQFDVSANIINGGTCVWDGYTLETIASVPDFLPVSAVVPHTEPNGIAHVVLFDNAVARTPLQYMWVLKDPNGNFIPFMTGGTLEGCMAWKMDVYNKSSIGQLQGFSIPFRLSCGAGG